MRLEGLGQTLVLFDTYVEPLRMLSILRQEWNLYYVSVTVLAICMFVIQFAFVFLSICSACITAWQ
jgi:hypothetical protein